MHIIIFFKKEKKNNTMYPEHLYVKQVKMFFTLMNRFIDYKGTAIIIIDSLKYVNSVIVGPSADLTQFRLIFVKQNLFE